MSLETAFPDFSPPNPQRADPEKREITMIDKSKLYGIALIQRAFLVSRTGRSSNLSHLVGGKFLSSFLEE